MRLYQIYKQVNGRRTFVGRATAGSAEEMAALLPELPPGERYDAPVECHDPREYQSAIREYEDSLAREHLPDKRGELRTIINGLRVSLQEMEPQGGAGSP